MGNSQSEVSQTVFSNIQRIQNTIDQSIHICKPIKVHCIRDNYIYCPGCKFSNLRVGLHFVKVVDNEPICVECFNKNKIG